MESIENYHKLYFTDKGFETLKTRLRSLIDLFNKNSFPCEHIIFGFQNKLIIEEQGECFGRIRELSEILNIPIKLIKLEKGGIVSYKIE